jgi:pyruvate/2-oxoglutarate dehydrogenase complex dihydrolipoamide dehydrogenase (E3) component
MAELTECDICVIGAGSGGLSVAAAAAQFGASVVLIEKGKMGGDCLNYGCVPSKALIAAAKAAYSQSHSAQFGIAPVRPEVDFKAVHRHIHGVIAAIEPADSQERFEGLGVDVIRAEGTFVDKKTVQAGDRLISARRFVIATGSSPGVPPINGLGSVAYLTNETIFDNTELPETLIIIGGGPIGMEMAQAHARLGSRVTVLEAMTPLSKDDPELTKFVLSKVVEDGVRVMAGAKIVSIKQQNNEIVVEVEAEGKNETLTAAKILVAAGRSPNVSGLGLDNAGIKHSNRGINVNKAMKTSNRRVYAIGDVAGSFQFTHVANYHAGLVIRNALFGVRVKERTDHIPWVTFTDPELANVGLSEEQARAKFRKINVLRWPFAENDRAQAERKAGGLIKVIVTPKGKILGAAIVGANAGELIQPWSLAISSDLNIKAFTDYVVPYPTMGEVSKRAAVTYYSNLTSNFWLKTLRKITGKFG